MHHWHAHWQKRFVSVYSFVCCVMGKYEFLFSLKSLSGKNADRKAGGSKGGGRGGERKFAQLFIGQILLLLLLFRACYVSLHSIPFILVVTSTKHIKSYKAIEYIQS